MMQAVSLAVKAALNALLVQILHGFLLFLLFFEK
jgi:hypothetical protein